MGSYEIPSTLQGNPHGGYVKLDDANAAALREALLAVAYELRTANLIAMAQGQDAYEMIGKRLGISGV